MFESVEEPEKPKSTNYAGLFILAVTLPIFIFFKHIGKPYMAITVPTCVAANIFAVGICWRLRTRFWFWCVIVLILALHVPLILRVHWPQEWDFGRATGLVLLPISVLDGLITVGVVRFVEKFIVKTVLPYEAE